MIAAAALGERCEPRAHASLKKMANDPDPYLAATAVRALTLYPDAEVMATLEAVAKRGPAPVRRVARRFIASR
jgi:HEAT repeat protein